MGNSIRIWQPLPSSYESVTVSNSAIGLSASKYGPVRSASDDTSKLARKALITVETDQIRWTADGTTPTAAIGHRQNVDDVIELEGIDAIRLFRAIRVTTDASIKVTYYGG